MKRKMPFFYYKNCVSCGICAQACPVSSLSMTHEAKQGKYPNVFPELDAAKCIGCGQCAEICPMDVISMREAT